MSQLSIPDAARGATLYWKVTTHDLRPPVRGGPPIWDGATPHLLAGDAYPGLLDGVAGLGESPEAEGRALEAAPLTPNPGDTK